MLRCFAQSIARSRDWCGYWIVTKDGYPAPSNCTSGEDFGYSLPANFDVIVACNRRSIWTGDTAHLDPVFSNFCDRSIDDYVTRWDADHGGNMENLRRARVRGSYQGAPH
jgi:hypothetical protein